MLLSDFLFLRWLDLNPSSSFSHSHVSGNGSRHGKVGPATPICLAMAAGMGGATFVPIDSLTIVTNRKMHSATLCGACVYDVLVCRCGALCE